MASRRRKTSDAKPPKYEESREQRIKENNERMKKLGLLDLALELKSPTTKRPYQKRNWSLSTSPRRSSRLKDANPINYSTFYFKKKKGFFEELDILAEDGCKAVDRNGKDGKHNYDPDKRETCHQCRQKTSRIHTHCTSCQAIRGQFCGGCLKARYGEDINKARQNAKWFCPVCREICNCSFCRKKKGLTPTGYIYGKALKLGFKSVADYVQTHPKDTAEVSD